MTDRMTQESLVRHVALRSGLTRDEAREAVQATLDIIAEALVEGYDVNLGNFGTFSTGDRPYSSGLLIGDGKAHAGTTRTVRFRATGRLKDAVRTGEAPETLRRTPKS